jgi:ankyrin repeat protein
MSEAAIDSSYKPNRPLFDAIKSNNIELTRLLLDGVSKTAKETNNNYDVNAETEEGFTPLIEATLTGNVDLVKLLLNHGAKAQPAPGFRHTPLRAACLTANLELIRLLLDEGADPNAQSDGGRTPLMGACFLRPQFDAAPNREELSLAAVEVMLSDSRTIPEIRNSFGESALDLCQGRNYRKSSEILRRVLYRREKTGQAQKAAGTN